ncbi:hypothetical protein GCM10010193_64990 [Kitasatospora atroaurantiaca]|uniref:Type A2 lantipeptide n=1 Tax=Kitasatospora atroaurantiaca TaxID=285545 RepID=A0A561EMD9_9ACTN|nr:hypothetical protein [Kitasatospora atroaurantiaca]TWE16796.1 hypothetical protein FB465_1787 [Kitasatospora atroaurantiaca]
MRKDFTSQVETREISDSDLDNISGGIASARVSALGVGAGAGVGDVVGTVESILPVGQVTGLVGQVTGLASVQTVGLGL